MEDEGPQEFAWHFDWTTQREVYHYTKNPAYPPNTTVLFIYHGKWAPGGPSCMDSNDCATIFTWGPKLPCTGTNSSNTMDKLFGWLTHDEFTNQSATFVRHDEKHGCNLWQHVSSPEYPAQINQTACVAQPTSSSYWKRRKDSLRLSAGA